MRCSRPDNGLGGELSGGHGLSPCSPSGDEVGSRDRPRRRPAPLCGQRTKTTVVCAVVTVRTDLFGRRSVWSRQGNRKLARAAGQASSTRARDPCQYMANEYKLSARVCLERAVRTAKCGCQCCHTVRTRRHHPARCVVTAPQGSHSPRPCARTPARRACTAP